MKRNHIISVLCIIFAGLAVWKGAVGIGVAAAVFGVIVLINERLPGRVRHVGIMVPVVLLALTAYRDFGSGEFGYVIIAGLVLVVGLLLTLFQVNERVRFGFRSVSFVAIAFLFIVALYFFVTAGRKADSVAKPVGERPASTVTDEAMPKTAATRTDIFRVKKLRELVGSESFAQALDENPEAMQSLPQFMDLLVAQGMTEYEGVDFSAASVQNHYQGLFQKVYPGKTPTDLDPEMEERFLDTVEALGYDAGRKDFVGSQDVSIWAMARFDMFDEGGETISKWLDAVYIGADAGQPESTSGAIDPVESDRIIEAADRLVVEPGHPEPERTADPAVETGTANLTDPVIVTDKPVPPDWLSTDNTVSADQLEQVLSVLDRYGETEGLRQLRETDPALADRLDKQRKAQAREVDDR